MGVMTAEGLMAVFKQQEGIENNSKHITYMRKILLGKMGKELGIDKRAVYDACNRASSTDTVDIISENIGVPSNVFFRCYSNLDVRHIFLDIKKTPVWKDFTQLSDKHGMSVALVFNARNQTMVITNKNVYLRQGQSALIVKAEQPYPNAFVLTDGIEGINL